MWPSISCGARTWAGPAYQRVLPSDENAPQRRRARSADPIILSSSGISPSCSIVDTRSRVPFLLVLTADGAAPSIVPYLGYSCPCYVSSQRLVCSFGVVRLWQTVRTTWVASYCFGPLAALARRASPVHCYRPGADRNRVKKRPINDQTFFVESGLVGVIRTGSKGVQRFSRSTI